MSWKPQATLEAQKAYQALAAISTGYSTITPFHNWQIANILAAPTIAHIIGLEKLYRRIVNIPGSIYEFGCHVGTSSSLLYQFRSYYEPQVFREFHLYDTFEGIPESGPTNKYDYSLPKDYVETLQEIFECHKSIIKSCARPCPVYVHKNNIQTLLSTAISQHSPVALAIIDVDVPETVSHIIDLIVDSTIPGSVIVYGGIGPTVPGVWQAIVNSRLSHLALKTVPGMQYLKYAICD
jgi:hypothetical protein